MLQTAKRRERYIFALPTNVFEKLLHIVDGECIPRKREMMLKGELIAFITR